MKTSEQTTEMVKEARGVVIISIIMALCMFGVYAWAIITGVKEPFDSRTLCLILPGLLFLGEAGYFYFEYRREKKHKALLEKEERQEQLTTSNQK